MSKPVNKRLGDIVNFKRGYDLPSYKRKEGPYPIVSSSGISGYHAEYKAKGEGLITGRYGTLGEMYYVNGKYWPHNTALYVTDFKGNYPKYVYFLLKCLGSLKTSDKSTVPGVNRNDLHELLVPYIKPELQKPIADFLFLLESKIDLNNRINSELEAMAKTLYDYWFVQFDFPDKNGKPYKSCSGKIVWNKELKREIPEGWKVGSLLDIAEYINGLPCQKYRPIGTDFLYVIKIREMRDGFTSESELVRPDIPQKAIIENGDVLFSWSASLEVQIWTGGKGALNQHIFKVTSKKYPKSFYYYQLVNYLQHFKMMADNRRTTMGHITQDHLKQSRIVLPPIELTEKLECKLGPIRTAITSNQLANNTLSSLRDWLLPMLMNGQVKVG
ncbi:restriction endonuclease subunit S [Geotalea uraniireducens]|uniref:Restriction modification system DNA specificity domain n=1 Tax=Geotalea uraniireducens (strain Rf4) TaxID=351605 RepID=A5GCE1_GEOUR|nr:restriction endonuclease subunit S [Geotalea uraniireducens]ABQ24763.1 restriction modification system DNA specificity domain [Geotalea uraniireducens Rf4]